MHSHIYIIHMLNFFLLYYMCTSLPWWSDEYETTQLLRMQNLIINVSNKRQKSKKCLVNVRKIRKEIIRGIKMKILEFIKYVETNLRICLYIFTENISLHLIFYNISCTSMFLLSDVIIFCWRIKATKLILYPKFNVHHWK